MTAGNQIGLYTRMRQHPSEIDDGSVKGDGMSGCVMQPLIRVCGRNDSERQKAATAGREKETVAGRQKAATERVKAAVTGRVKES